MAMVTAGMAMVTVLGSVLGTALIVTNGAKDIAMLGSAEEATSLMKTEKMAHAAALGSAHGASDALKARWWPQFFSRDDSGKGPAKAE
jgi:fructose/tagatose bisphosphate aldolase